MIYHLKNDKNHVSQKKFSSSNDDRKTFFFSFFKRKNVELIMFLNRMLTSAEEKYWFTKLKMIDLIWLIKRIRRLIETFKHVIIIYTNHAVNSFITRQIKFTNNNIDKLNMKLIRTSIYFFQFRLNICKIDIIDFVNETLTNVFEMKNVKCNNIYLNMLKLKIDFRKIRKHFVI